MGLAKRRWRSFLGRVLGAGFLLGWGFAAAAADQADPGDLRGDSVGIEAFLRRFEANPVEAMKEPLLRRDESGAVVPPGARLKFSAAAVGSGKAVAMRDRFRAGMCMETEGKTKCLEAATGPTAQPLAVVSGNDLAEDLVDGGIVYETLEALEQQGLTGAALASQPWSDDYWGFFKGTLGARYADPGFPGSDPDSEEGRNWLANFEYVSAHPVSEIVDSGDPRAIDRLSPSEKYELLVGDGDRSLTRSQWAMGQEYSGGTGEIETWMGICHGWAPAAMMLPRPQGALSLLAADGVSRIRFYPSDIKALASLLWATGSAPARFVGGRCNDADPATDANGRVISPRCFDTNPATWHLAVTHQIGVARRSFVLDATYDYEVWNQPVHSYRYGYFNPKTGKTVQSIQEARVALGDFTGDKFRRYRGWDSASVVGIAMELTYVEETDPDHSETDSPARDSKRTVRYLYDLELDASGRIVGGEWYSRRHPDFIWVPTPDAHALSVGENIAQGSWDASQSLPWSWRQAAVYSARYGQPLGKLVESMMRWASKR